MTKSQPRYISYLLRLWQTGSKPAWRASLESLTGERQGFAGLEELFAFLKSQTGVERAAPDDGGHQINHSEH